MFFRVDSYSSVYVVSVGWIDERKCILQKIALEWIVCLHVSTLYTGRTLSWQNDDGSGLRYASFSAISAKSFSGRRDIVILEKQKITMYWSVWIIIKYVMWSVSVMKLDSKSANSKECVAINNEYWIIIMHNGIAREFQAFSSHTHITYAYACASLSAFMRWKEPYGHCEDADEERDANELRKRKMENGKAVCAHYAHLNEVRWTHVDLRFYSMPTHSLNGFRTHRAEWKMDVDDERYAMMIVEKSHMRTSCVRIYGNGTSGRCIWSFRLHVCVQLCVCERVCACICHLHAISKPSAVRCTHIRITYASMRNAHTVLVGSSRETVSATQLIRKLRLIALRIAIHFPFPLWTIEQSGMCSVLAAVVEKLFESIFSIYQHWICHEYRSAVQLKCMHECFTETFELRVPQRCHIGIISFTIHSRFFARLSPRFRSIAYTHTYAQCTWQTVQCILCTLRRLEQRLRIIAVN